MIYENCFDKEVTTTYFSLRDPHPDGGFITYHFEIPEGLTKMGQLLTLQQNLRRGLKKHSIKVMCRKYQLTLRWAVT
jgi:hypothetical protein